MFDAFISSDNAFRLRLNTSVARRCFWSVGSSASFSSRTSTTAVLRVARAFVCFVIFARAGLTAVVIVLEGCVFTLDTFVVLRGSLGGLRSHSRDATMEVMQVVGDWRALLMAAARASTELSAIVIVGELGY